MIRKIAYGLTVALTGAGLAAEYLLHAPPLVVFSLTGLALIGLAWLLSESTESLGHHTGPRIGGILNATLGNAAELIVGIFALAAGLTTVVKASIIGSVLSNTLLVMGTGVLLGGLKHGEQTFSGVLARANATMLALAAIGLSVPTIFATEQAGGAQSTEYLSITVGVILFVAYILLLVFYFTNPAASSTGAEQEGNPPFGRTSSFVLLAVSGAAVGWVSEVFVGTIEPVIKEIGMSELFVGLILIPIVGNAAEHATAVAIAYKNNMDFSMFISIGSSLQVALMVTSILVFVGPLLGNPLRLTFSILELGALAGAVVVAGLISLDGKSNWLEGVMLCGVYLIIAAGFFFI